MSGLTADAQSTRMTRSRHRPDRNPAAQQSSAASTCAILPVTDGQTRGMALSTVVGGHSDRRCGPSYCIGTDQLLVPGPAIAAVGEHPDRADTAIVVRT